jgi:phage baseplate assembly protein W
MNGPRNLDYPFHFDGSGLTAFTTFEDHIRDLVEQVLFTRPGERVNRPQFGAGVEQLVFAPAGDQLVAATQTLVSGALHQWLGDLIQVDSVEVARQDSTLTVTVRYIIRRTTESLEVEFTRSI